MKKFDNMEDAVEYVEKLQLLMRDATSLNTIVGTDEHGETELGDLIEDENAKSPEQIAIESYEKENLWKIAEAHLSPRELSVIKMRMGYDTCPMTLQEIANVYSVTRERIRQIESKALAKLKRYYEKYLYGWSEN